jgi:hypothetical protein
MKLLFTARFLPFILLILFSCTFSFRSDAGTAATIAGDSKAGDFDIKNSSFLLPQDQAPGHYSSSLFLLNIFMPPDWTLDVIKTPMICYVGKYSLSHGLNIQANVSTMFVSSRIMAGPWWNHSVNNFHYGVGYQVAFNYGVLNQFGFHTTLTGWEQQPSVAAGYSFKNMAVTLRGDLYITNALYLHEGGYTVPFTDTYLNGFSITTSLEQRLVKNKVMSVGFKASYLRYHVLAWPAFPVNAYHYFVPEVQLGLNF